LPQHFATALEFSVDDAVAVAVAIIAQVAMNVQTPPSASTWVLSLKFIYLGVIALIRRLQNSPSAEFAVCIYFS
jgi:hypothetical protein